MNGQKEVNRGLRVAMITGGACVAAGLVARLVGASPSTMKGLVVAIIIAGAIILEIVEWKRRSG